MTRVVIYTPSASGPSGPRQAETLRRFAAERGWAVVAAYHEPPLSGCRKAGGPAWQRLLAEAQEIRPDILPVHDLCRLGRSLSILLGRCRALQKYGIRLVSVAESLGVRTLEGGTRPPTERKEEVFHVYP